MINRNFFIFTLLLLVLTSSAYASVCQSVSSDLTLDSDVSTINQTCFEIAANDVVLDCAGFSINITTPFSNQGVNNNGFDNVTVQHCTFYVDRGSMIKYRNANEGLIFNNTINEKTNILQVGIDIGQSSNITIDQNTVTVETGNNILIDDSFDMTIINNTLIPAANQVYALFVDGPLKQHYNHTVTNNNIPGVGPLSYTFAQDDIVISDVSNFGEVFIAFSDNVTFDNISLVRNGIITKNVTNSNFDILNITSNTKHGVWFIDTVNTTIATSYVETQRASTYPVYIKGGNNNNVIDSTLKSLGFRGHTVFLQNTDQTTITNTNLDAVSSQGSGHNFLITNSDNTIIQDSILNNDGDWPVFIDGGSVNISITNTTYLGEPIVILDNNNNSLSLTNLDVSQLILYQNNNINISNSLFDVNGILAIGVTDLLIENNNFTTTTTPAVSIIGGGSNKVIRNNNIITTNDATPGISVSVTSSIIIEDNIITTSGNDGITASSAAIFLLSVNSPNTIRNNTITSTGNSDGGIHVRGSFLTNIVDNFVNATGIGSSSIIIDQFSATVQSLHTITNNEFYSTGANGYGVRFPFGGAFTISNNTVFTDNTIFSTNNWIGTFNNFSALSTFVNTTFINDFGNVNYQGTVPLYGNNTLSQNTFSIADNSVFLNSSFHPAFNTSATITLNNLLFTLPVISADFNDDGNFIACPLATCQLISNSPSETIFDVTHFTEYIIEENVVPTVTVPSIAGSDASTPVNAETTYNDNNSQVGTVYFEWFVNGGSVVTNSVVGVTPGSIAANSLSSSFFQGDDTVRVEVHANDGLENSTTLSSSTITISATSVNDSISGDLLFILSAFGIVAIIIGAIFILLIVNGAAVDMMALSGTIIALAAGFGILITLLTIILRSLGL